MSATASKAAAARYRRHQAEKLSTIGRDRLVEYHHNLRHELRTRLSVFAPSRTRNQFRNALCLGARTGGEVEALRDLGLFAVGVDLNPGADNPFVLCGDFHRLHFPSGSVDLVYTNSLDHVLDLGAVLSEVRRLLTIGGRFIVDAVRGTEEGWKPGKYETLTWPTVDWLLSQIEAGGLALSGRHGRRPIEFPWSGEQLTLYSKLK